MAYKLVVEDTVKVPVKFTLNNAGKVASFSFSLTCDRLTQEEIRERTKDGDGLVSDFLRGVIKGWSGQTLVVDEDDKPAEFNTEALDVMLSTTGVPIILYHAYFKECGAKEKN